MRLYDNTRTDPCPKIKANPSLQVQMTMPNLEQQIKQLVDDILDTKAKLSGFLRVRPPAPAPNPPAGADALRSLDKRLKSRGLSLPPSYKAFLSVYSGIADFDGHLDLLDAQHLLQPIDPSLVSDFPDLSKFVIALGNTPAFISFDPRSVNSSGEMEVVWVMPDGGEFRYPDFRELLRTYGAELKKTLKQRQSDRKGIKH